MVIEKRPSEIVCLDMAIDDLEVPDGGESRFNFEEFLYRFRFPILFILSGLIILGVGFFYFNGGFDRSGEVEVLENATEAQSASVTVEISGAVISPGVYRLKDGDRVEDLLVLSKGVSADADRVWMEKYLNRAAKLVDGQKVYIPKKEETQSLKDKQTLGDQTISSTFSLSGESLININASDQKTLETLPGIGPVYAQKIIEQRPYSDTSELASKKIIPRSTYEKIKDKISVY